MLKLVLLDVNPYLIDGRIVNELTWKDLEQQNVLSDFIDLFPELDNLFKKNKSLFNYQENYLSIMDAKSYDSLVQKWNVAYSQNVNNYINKKEVDQTVLKLVNDADENEVKIVFVTNNSNFCNLSQLFNKYYKEKRIDVLKLSDFCLLNTEFVIDYASNLGASYEEIAVVTQQSETIQDLVNNNIFTITIDGKNKMINYNFVSLENNDQLNIDQILYFYHEYEKNSKTGI